MLGSLDTGPVAELAAKLRELYETIQPRDSALMLNFVERDLVLLAEAAGFDDIHLELTPN